METTDGGENAPHREKLARGKEHQVAFFEPGEVERPALHEESTEESSGSCDSRLCAYQRYQNHPRQNPDMWRLVSASMAEFAQHRPDLPCYVRADNVKVGFEQALRTAKSLAVGLTECFRELKDHRSMFSLDGSEPQQVQQSVNFFSDTEKKVVTEQKKKQQDRFGVLLSNCHTHVDLFLAAAATRSQMICINHRLGIEEMQAVLRNCRCSVLFADVEMRSVLTQNIDFACSPIQAVVWIASGEHGPSSVRFPAAEMDSLAAERLRGEDQSVKQTKINKEKYFPALIKDKAPSETSPIPRGIASSPGYQSRTSRAGAKVWTGSKQLQVVGEDAIFRVADWQPQGEGQGQPGPVLECRLSDLYWDAASFCLLSTEGFDADEVLLQGFLTSGTTGVPKLVGHSHSMVYAHTVFTFNALKIPIGFPGDDVENKFKSPSFTTGRLGPRSAALVQEIAAVAPIHGDNGMEFRAPPPCSVRNRLEGTVTPPVQECFAHVGPLFHCGTPAFVWICLMAGAKQVFHPNQFRFLEVAELLSAEDVTMVKLMPTLLTYLINAQEVKRNIASGKWSFDTLKWILTGGMKPSKEIIEATKEVFDCDFVQGYGMTEATVHTAFKNESRLPLEVGLTPLPGLDLVLVNTDTGRWITEPNEVGEISVRGPTVFKGYTGNAVANSKAFVNIEHRDAVHRYYLSGDLGYWNEYGEGRRELVISGRSKDMIIVAGENVFAVEVENVITRVTWRVAGALHGETGDEDIEPPMPAIRRCAVFGVADETLGEIVAAAILLTEDDCPVSDQELRKLVMLKCRRELAPYKVPAYVYLWTGAEFPMTSSGKVRKQGVQEACLSGDMSKLLAPEDLGDADGDIIDSFEDLVVFAISDVFGDSSVLETNNARDTNFATMGMSSLDYTRVQKIIQNRTTGAPLSPMMLFENDNVNALIRYLESRPGLKIVASGEGGGDLAGEYGGPEAKKQDMLFDLATLLEQIPENTGRWCSPWSLFYQILVICFRTTVLAPPIVFAAWLGFSLYADAWDLGLSWCILLAPMVYPLSVVALLLLVLLVKWVVFGRGFAGTKIHGGEPFEGDSAAQKLRVEVIPLWTPTYYRWLASYHLFQTIDPFLAVFRGTPIIALFYRLCGAKIGSLQTVSLHTSNLTDVDRLSIESGCYIDRSCNVQPSFVTSMKGGFVVLGTIQIQRGSFLSYGASVTGPSIIPKYSIVRALQAVSWSQPVLVKDAKISNFCGVPEKLRQWHRGSALKFFVLLYVFGALVAFPILFASWCLVELTGKVEDGIFGNHDHLGGGEDAIFGNDDHDHFRGGEDGIFGNHDHFRGGVPCVADTFLPEKWNQSAICGKIHHGFPLVFWVLLPFAAFFVSPHTYFLGVVFVKRLICPLIGSSVEAGEYKNPNDFGHWLYLICMDFPLFRIATQYTIMTQLTVYQFRLLGAHIGSRVYFCAPFIADPEHVEIADDGVCAGNTALLTTSVEGTLDFLEELRRRQVAEALFARNEEEESEKKEEQRSSNAIINPFRTDPTSGEVVVDVTGEFIELGRKPVVGHYSYLKDKTARVEEGGTRTRDGTTTYDDDQDEPNSQFESLPAPGLIAIPIIFDTGAQIANTVVLHGGVSLRENCLIGDGVALQATTSIPEKSVVIRGSSPSNPHIVLPRGFAEREPPIGCVRFYFLQFYLILLSLFLTAGGYVPGYLLLGTILHNRDQAVPEGTGACVLLPLFLLLMLLAKTLHLVLFKWLILGRVRPNEAGYRFFGLRYCHWIAFEGVLFDLDVTFLTNGLSGTYLLGLLYRLLGADISLRPRANVCLLNSSVGCEYDLKHVAKNAVLNRGALLFGHSIERVDRLVLRHCHIGEAAAVGALCAVEAGARLTDGQYLANGRAAHNVSPVAERKKTQKVPDSDSISLASVCISCLSTPTKFLYRKTGLAKARLSLTRRRLSLTRSLTRLGSSSDLQNRGKKRLTKMKNEIFQHGALSLQDHFLRQKAAREKKKYPPRFDLGTFVNLDDFERVASRILPIATYDYYRGGADSETALGRNRAMWSQYQILPRCLVPGGVSKLNLGGKNCTYCGVELHCYSGPYYWPPQRCWHRWVKHIRKPRLVQREEPRKLKVGSFCHLCPTLSNCSLEQVSEEYMLASSRDTQDIIATRHPLFFQLYVFKNRSNTMGSLPIIEKLASFEAGGNSSESARTFRRN